MAFVLFSRCTVWCSNQWFMITKTISTCTQNRDSNIHHITHRFKCDVIFSFSHTKKRDSPRAGCVFSLLPYSRDHLMWYRIEISPIDRIKAAWLLLITAFHTKINSPLVVVMAIFFFRRLPWPNGHCSLALFITSTIFELDVRYWTTTLICLVFHFFWLSSLRLFIDTE